MDKSILIQKLDKLTQLLNIPEDIVDEHLRYNKNDIYYFPQKTEEVFDVLITDLQNINTEKRIKSSFHLNNIDAHTLFEEINNPVLIYENYDLWKDHHDRNETTDQLTYLFMWDYKDDTKVFYVYYNYSCPYHFYKYSDLWTQTIDSFLEECNGEKLDTGYSVTEKGVEIVLNRLRRERRK